MDNAVFRFFALSVFILCIGCYRVNDAHTPQQKSLTTKAFDIISSPSPDDQFFDDSDQDFVPDEIDTDPIINENFYKPISISVTENMSIREVLTQMASLAGVNIFIVHDREGGISFTAKNRPFLDILKDICTGIELKYSINGNSVKIEDDSPTLKVYNIQFLNIQRDTQSSVSTSTDIFMNQSIGIKNSTTPSMTSSSTNNGSRSSVTGIVKNDFWLELESTLKSIIGAKEHEYVSIHKQGGLITVFTTQNKHEEIQKYLQLLKDSSESQVLIEAKILEVNLDDKYRSGINWSAFKSGTFFNKEYDTSELFTLGIDRKNINVVSGFIEKFGAVKTLSSPRITVLNNQTAILKVAQNEVIYTPEIQKQYGSISNNVNTDYMTATINTIPIGLIMSVQPSIDKKNNSIILTLRPTISKIVQYKEVPFFFQNIIHTLPKNTDDPEPPTPQVQTQRIPIVDVREIDSVLKLNSGQIVVMGGLMQENSNNQRDGIPRVNELTPFDLFTGSNEKNTTVTELVIFLKATILRKKSKAHHNADKKVYNVFANDPRPLRFENEKIKASK